MSGLGGKDVLDLASLNPNETSFPVTLLGGDADDVIRTQTTTAGSTVTMLGGNGADALQVYTIAGATPFVADTTDGIASQIIADGELGVDSLTIRNSGSTLGANTVVATNFSVDGITPFAGPDVTHTNVETIDVTSTSFNDIFQIEYTGGQVTSATFRGFDGNDWFGGNGPLPVLPPAQPIPDLLPSVQTSIFIFGGNPVAAAPYGNDPTKDRLYIDMSAVNAPVVVDTVGGIAKSINAVPSHKPVSFKEIEFIQLRDNVIVGGVPVPGTVVPGVIRGDLYFRGTSGIDKVDFQRSGIVNVFDPTEVQIMLGSVRNGPYYPTHRIVAYGRQGDDQITINGSLNANPNLQGADLYGETGNDYLAGNLRNDSFYGGDGNDKLLLDGGDNYGEGGAGSDSISGAAGKDTIYGCAGTDTLFGGGGDDLIYGGADRDLIQGQDGNDIIRGDTGDDSLNGGNGSDILIAGDGNDTLIGETGRDFLIGGNGADTLTGYQDDDIVVAGRTSYDAASAANDQAMLSIMAEWNSGNTVAVRRTNIRAGVGVPLAWLEFSSTGTNAKNVFDDSPAIKDTINTMTPGSDWIMAGNGNGTTTKDKVSVSTGHIVDYHS
jgi:Ca2+-binding RTX toxin-like protein